MHINALIDGSVRLSDFQILVFGGGFSWGDDHGAGVIQAVRMKTRLGDGILEFVAAGKLVLGICNGFQTLVNMGLLPALDGDDRGRTVALIHNDCGNFQDRWVHLRVNPDTPCVFTRSMDRLELPVRHGEGKFYAARNILKRLTAANQVALRYTLADGERAGGLFPHNPSGSLDDIAGICDPSGRVFGLMPHPEGYNHWTNHPDWSRTRYRTGRADHAGEPTPGIRMFVNAVRYFR